MRFIRHTEECASKPDTAGRLTGKCNCKTAPLDDDAQTALESLLDKLETDSIQADESSTYFALRLDELAALITKEARVVRRRGKHADSKVRLRRAKRMKGPSAQPTKSPSPQPTKSPSSQPTKSLRA